MSQSEQEELLVLEELPMETVVLVVLVGIQHLARLFVWAV
jgi:hypothetical protein